MYVKFFGLKEKPFNLVPNPGYLYLSSAHSNALSYLEYGLSENIGFLMLTGEIGTGKTTLLKYLLNRMPPDTDVAFLFNTSLYSRDLVQVILDRFDVEFDRSISQAQALELLYEDLIHRYSKGRKVLLVIDEAQNLSATALEEIRMLSNLQTDEDMLLKIMIIGQPELRDKIREPGLEQFAQRIAASYHLAGMDKKETALYIAHRVALAGGSTDLFTEPAMEKIFEVSQGIPRIINLVCEAALVYGYADEKNQITLDLVNQVVQDKGGMGVFTKTALGSVGKKDGKPKAAASADTGRVIPEIADLARRVGQLEDSITLLHEKFDRLFLRKKVLTKKGPNRP